MNHRGQTLVLFILLLPIILLALAFVVDIGLLTNMKKGADQKLEQIIQSGLENNITEEEWNKLVLTNFENLELKQVTQTNDSVEITIQIKLEPLFPHIMLQNRYKVTYLGYIENETIKIIRK